MSIKGFFAKRAEYKKAKAALTDSMHGSICVAMGYRHPMEKKEGYAPKAVITGKMITHSHHSFDETEKFIAVCVPATRRVYMDYYDVNLKSIGDNGKHGNARVSTCSVSYEKKESVRKFYSDEVVKLKKVQAEYKPLFSNLKKEFRGR